MNGRRLDVEGGRSLSVGRTQKSDFAITADGYMSGRHFAVESDGQQFVVRDLGSSNGTFLNGSRITDAMALQPLDLIQAGASKFRVHIQSGDLPADHARTSTMPRNLVIDSGLDKTQVGGLVPGLSVGTAAGVADERWTGFNPSQALLLDALFGTNEPVYAVLDANRDSLIRAFVEASGERHFPLTEAMVQGRPIVGVYLIGVNRGSRLLDVLVKDGWGKGWGVFCHSAAPPEAISAHLRSLFTFYTSGGTPVAFRFAEPNLLRYFLNSLSLQETHAIFGPVKRFVVEADGGESALKFSVGNYGLATETLRLKG
jgi:hypothetical protein